MYKLAVIGNPISHSLSPQVFDLFARQANISLRYNKTLATDAKHFDKIVDEFFADGGLALNITSPFKNTAYQVARNHTMRAQFCDASNFLRIVDGELIADTTDGLGLLNDMHNNKKLNLQAKKILILGSGFVLDSILLDLITANPKSIDVYARNQKRLNDLSNKFMVGVIPASAKQLKADYDIILNTTPNVKENILFANLDQLIDGVICYDLTYAVAIKDDVFFNTVSNQVSGAIGYNGLGMLVEQAKVAFETLFGCQVDSRKVILELDGR